MPHLERAYALSKKTAAMNVINRRQKIGEPATVEWIRESAKSQIPWSGDRERLPPNDARNLCVISY